MRRDGCFHFKCWYILGDVTTCAHDGCKHPALAVLDGAAAGLGPLPQDVPAPSPQGGVHSILEVPGPVSLQDSAVIFTVDLNMDREDTCQYPVFALSVPMRSESKSGHLTLI